MILTEQNANNMYTRVIHSLIGVASSLNANIDIRRHLNIVADDDEVFFNDYDSSTVDTGWLLFIIASAIAVLSVALLPVSVRIGRYLSSTHLFCKCKSDSTVVDSESSEDEEPPTLSEETESRTWMQNAFAWFLGHLIYRWDKRSSSRKQHRGDRTEAIKRARSKEKRESMLRRIVHASGNEEIELSVIALSHDIDTNQRTGTSRFLRSPQRSVISVAIDSVKKRRRRRRTPQRRGNQINSSSFGPFKTIIRFDHETKRILGLAIPFTVSAVIYTVCDLVIVGFVSQYLGTDAMVAYTMVGLTTGITGGFLGGFVGPLSSLGSCAYGAEIASRYVWLSMTMDVISGIDWVLYEFLEVSEKEVYANVIACIGAVLELPVVWAALHYYDSTLLFLGLVFLATQIVFMLLNICICVRMGWLEKYEDGIFHSLAFRNREALREYLKTAFPLALGSLLSYAEWEILTVLAAVLGPAEAATWAILGYVWDVFESTTGSLGSAGEIRCSYQLGQGKSHLAKLSSYKSMFLALVMSVLSTSIFLSLSTVLPAFLTSDETIQDMLIVLFPLVGLGNVMMSVGMVCWSLVGAQLRYRQATAIATATSVGITLPLGVIFTVVLNYDLKGLTFSVVVGYIMTAMILTSMLLISDWEKLSETIREKMVDKDEEEAEDGAAAPGGTQDTRNTENQCN
eukprot:scaffold7348_cov144-Skeletonema_menzelii.AAC.4